jgi:hypothetical protein
MKFYGILLKKFKGWNHTPEISEKGKSIERWRRKITGLKG